MADNLVIVESPAKAKTIEKYLGENYIVKSSFGHIRDLEKSKLSIDIDNNFEPSYIIPEDKKKVVAELKTAVKQAKTIWLASDEDREGEAIAWHLNETLNLKKKDTKRIVFNEITKTAILHAVENPRQIDLNLVNAQQARRVLDRIVGYKISPILWKKVKPALSAGRVQSVAVKLIVEKEKEIQDFVSTDKYVINALFFTANSEQILKATLNIKFDTEQEANIFLNECKASIFTVSSIEKKPTTHKPAPPFTTSTLQQEASRKLGYSVSQTMMVAQQLYESGLITYMRTDSVNLSEVALSGAKDAIEDFFGKKYYKQRKFTTKTKGAQEAHEAIRPTDLSRKEISGDNYQQKLYSLIYKRMLASQMADAKTEKTTIKIKVSNREEYFISQGEILLFDGFLKLYQVSVDENEQDENEQQILPNLSEGEIITLKQAVGKQNFSNPPARYNEASLVKKMEDLGIGRPSTYAPTITTIQKRDYIYKRSLPYQTREIKNLVLENNEIKETIQTENYGKEINKLVPTDIGIVVNNFLTDNFKDIMDYNFTAGIENQFDKIAQGKIEWQKVMSKFYQDFNKEVQEVSQNSQKNKGDRLIGMDPKTGKKVIAKIGRFGTMVQLGERKEGEPEPKYAALKKNQSINSITLEEALSLFELPRVAGQYEDADIVVSNGRFGPYLKWNEKNITLPKNLDPYTISIDQCIEQIKLKLKKEELTKDLPKTICLLDQEPIVMSYGRFGFFLSFKKKNYRIPKELDIKTITEQQAKDIVSGKLSASNKKPIKEFDNGAQLLEGRFGAYIKYKNKNYKMPKDIDISTLTNEQLEKIISK